MARAAIDGGAHVLSLINTYVALAIDLNAMRPAIGNVTGGFSGPAIKPLALFNVHKVYRDVAKAAGIPIVGMGGIRNARDALEFLLAGASAVSVGTHLFVDPTSPLKIAEGISEFMRARNIARVGDLTGALQLS
jgi:dihydroorotate dehydrogenase (NAD+) catalytic subunit